MKTFPESTGTPDSHLIQARWLAQLAVIGETLGESVEMHVTVRTPVKTETPTPAEPAVEL